jgi:hypothetical protein
VSHVVRVSAREQIVPHGTQKITWWVHDGQRWLSARDYPGGTFERMEAGPSVVWETVATLSVPAGTWLLELNSVPRQTTKRDPLHYLQHDAMRAQTRWTRRYYIVDPRGKLIKAGASQTPPQDDDALLAGPR